MRFNDEAFSVFQVKAQTEQRNTPVSEAKKTPAAQTQTTCSSQFIPIHHPGAFPPLPSRPGSHTLSQPDRCFCTEPNQNGCVTGITPLISGFFCRLPSLSLCDPSPSALSRPSGESRLRLLHRRVRLRTFPPARCPQPDWHPGREAVPHSL